MIQIQALLTSLQDTLSDLAGNEQSDAIKLIEALISEGGLHRQSNWAGHMTPSVEQSALLGQLLAGLHNGNMLSADLYPELAKIESQLINWFCDLFQQQSGHFTHGSSYGNLEALWQARERTVIDSNIVYGSSAAHYSIAKACRILGLEFRPIAANQQGQIQITDLQQACQQKKPLAIVATAGTSSCGAIDPLAECIELAHPLGSWCHIDAAWGGALALVGKLTEIEHADSLCFDPHKALGQPKPSSVLLYQHNLEPFTDSPTDYLSLSPNKTLAGSYGGELFLPLWCSLLFNRDKLASQVEERLVQAQLFAEQLRQRSDWTIWHSETGIVCFAPTEEIELSSLSLRGIISEAKINQQPVYRAVFASHTTRAEALLTELAPYL